MQAGLWRRRFVVVAVALVMCSLKAADASATAMYASGDDLVGWRNGAIGLFVGPSLNDQEQILNDAFGRFETSEPGGESWWYSFASGVFSSPSTLPWSLEWFCKDCGLVADRDDGVNICDSDSVPTPAPEPPTDLLMALGLSAIVAILRFRKTEESN